MAAPVGLDLGKIMCASSINSTPTGASWVGFAELLLLEVLALTPFFSNARAFF